MGEEVRTEKIYPVTNYTNIMWLNLSHIAQIADETPEKAYRKLRYLIPLLPVQVKEALRPVNKWLEEEAEKVREEVSAYSDKVIAAHIHRKMMRSLIKQYILKALNIISDEMERMNLKWFVAGFPWKPFDGGSVRWGRREYEYGDEDVHQ